MEQLTLWDIERPENSPVDCFQRDGAGRPRGTGQTEGYDDEGNLINPKDNEEG